MEYTWNDSDREDLLQELMSDLEERTYGGWDLSCLNESEKNFYLTMLLTQEVLHGTGFTGFFLDNGEFFSQLPDAFAAIGAVVPTAICWCAVQTAGKDIPEDPADRENMLNALDFQERMVRNAVFDQCDIAFRALESNVMEQIYDFVANNQADFPAYVLEEPYKPTPSPASHPFRDNPYYFRGSGSLIYHEPSNPYETVEVYLDLQPDFVGIKSYISEHGPDGGSSWRGIFLDIPNIRKLQKIVGSNIEFFFANFYRENSNKGIIALAEFLTEHGISFEQKWAF